MTGPLDKPMYTPQPPAGSDVASWAYREMIVISQALSNPPGWYLTTVNAVPSRPRNGLLAFADGTNWNPGAGRGLYVYDGQWKLLLDNTNTTGVWTGYAPSVAAQAGTFTTVSAAGSWVQLGKTIHFDAVITMTAIGTAAGGLIVGLPIVSANLFVVAGREVVMNGKMASGTINVSGTTVVIQNYDGSTAIVNGGVIIVSGTYETT